VDADADMTVIILRPGQATAADLVRSGALTAAVGVALPGIE
jgi:hypothetical protein